METAQADRLMAEVLVMPLKMVLNERGHLMEVQRIDDRHFPGFGQVYVTATNPGIVKAWYRHHKQVDQVALVKGELLLVLFDTRGEAPTFGQLQKIHFTEDKPLLVQIPPGVWHGFQALGAEPALLVHLNTVAYDFQNVDEDLLAADDPSIPHSWSR